MRLIDADAMKKRVIGKVLEDLIDEQPTAYDIDKVVEELEKEKEIHTEHFRISIYKDMPEIKQRYKQALGIIDKAIEIVKAGGKNEMSVRK